MNVSTGTSRLFVAVPLPQPIRAALQQQMEKLKPAFPFQKWVHSDDLHITLKFLGETSPQKAEQVQAELGRIASGHNPVSLSVQGIGTFGKPASPSILWIGIHGDLPLLASLQADVDAALEPLGFAKEDRAFRPHLTVARRYNGTSAFSKAMLQSAPVFPSSTWVADHIMLYRSHLNRQPMYEAWKSYPLDGVLPDLK
ncbi:RNA 2',3'-cyclic phosphodiesterase [Paenibacillus allorhizosphaerae]|uniref:RNA 2',3'-cyclic phosphodiesterase n=1 Tax=Paenibacillus allorhizosphaerae TaxID=2849866 RepID=A0ABM8VES4_9BACL|nr:RNA 2',3'-cyclic phosphodiesterase [Paenibacillus allorhizosphaerae]CAG7632305.1 RNA 2',3'-cyclic phosphodiesterase [Paenibacillus allorhizosphaerae]